MFEIRVPSSLRAKIEDVMADAGIPCDFNGECIMLFDEMDIDKAVKIIDRLAPSRPVAAPNVSNNVKSGGSMNMFKGSKGKMANVFKGMADNFFKKVEGVVISFEGKVGIQSPDGVVTFDKDTQELTVNPLSLFNVDIPAFAIRTPVTGVQVGDIAVEGGIGFVTAVKDGKVKVVRPKGTNASFNPPTNALFGAPSILVVKNMFGDATTNPMMMMALASMGEDGDSSSMMEMMMMQQMMGGQTAGATGGFMSNPMMMMLMMKDGGNSDMFQTMMMMEMMKNGGLGILPWNR